MRRPQRPRPRAFQRPRPPIPNFRSGVGPPYPKKRRWRRSLEGPPPPLTSTPTMTPPDLRAASPPTVPRAPPGLGLTFRRHHLQITITTSARLPPPVVVALGTLADLAFHLFLHTRARARSRRRGPVESAARARWHNRALPLIPFAPRRAWCGLTACVACLVVSAPPTSRVARPDP